MIQINIYIYQTKKFAITRHTNICVVIYLGTKYIYIYIYIYEIEKITNNNKNDDNKNNTEKN